MTEIKTPWLRFTGMNVRGTPRMSYEAVMEDVRSFAESSDSGQFQEFKWDYYWKAAERALGDDYFAWPGFERGYLEPVLSAQPHFWNKHLFKSNGRKRTLCHIGWPGISETRFFRAVLLTYKDKGLSHWEVNGHFVVGGDQDDDEPRRKRILRRNIRRWIRFLKKLKRTGKAIIGQLDANIRSGGSWAYRLFMSQMLDIGARFHGTLGVEYLFTIDAHSDVKIKVKTHTQMYPKSVKGKLNTDHESRGLVYRLVKKAEGLF